MGRRNRRAPATATGETPAGARSVLQNQQTFRGEWYEVRRLTGSSATHDYRCPGCDQLLSAGSPHVVAWPVPDAELRRHWHTNCWAARETRRPAR